MSNEVMSRGPIKHQILLIEDNPLTIKMVRLTLETAGYLVIHSEDGESAIAAMTAHAPDLVLLDMRLPDTTGLNLIKQLRTLPNGEFIPIIAFSGFVSMVEEAKIANSGFTDFLLKPVEPSLLLECVGNHLVKVDVENESVDTKRTALILDDDPLQLKFTGLQFNHAGFEVISAVDGLEGLSLAQQHLPDVIVSDVLMPNMDGFQFCKAARDIEALSNTPIILVSANYVEEIDQELAKNIGANAYVYRSLGIQKVIDTVLKCMGNIEALAPVVSNKSSTGIEKDIHTRMLQQLERQVSINIASRQRSYVQHTILGQISDIANALLQNEDSSLPLDDILSRCLDSAGLSQGIFYYKQAIDPLCVRTQYGFIHQIENLQNCFGYQDIFLDIIQNQEVVAIPSAAMDHATSGHILSISDSSSALLIPVRGQNDTSGLLAIFSSQDMLVEDDWLAFGRNVASQFSQATELSDAFSRLVDSEQRFRQLAENVRDAFFLIVPSTFEILYLSPAYESIWERSAEDLINEPTSWVDSVVPEDKALFECIMKQLSSTGQFAQELRIISPSGHVKWIKMRGAPILDESGKLSRVAGIVEDITERRNSEIQIQNLNLLYELLSGINALTVRAQNQEELFKDTCRITVEIGNFDLAWIGLINYANNTVVPTAKFGKNDNAQTLTDSVFSTLPNDANQNSIISKVVKSKHIEWMNDSLDDLIDINTKRVFKLSDCRSMICLPLISDNNVVGIAMLLSKPLINFNASKVKLLNELARDISYAFRFLQAKKHIEFLALHDPLTGLGNRVSLKQRLKSAIVKADYGSYTFGLMLVNLNRFRDINDTLGHKTGDTLLKEVAARLVNTVWRSDMVACLGGDEFALLIPHLTKEQDMRLVANKVNEALRSGFQIQNIPLNIEARIGIALYPADAEKQSDLWRCADVALSAAGKLKKSVCFYHAKYDDFDSKNLSLLGELREAIERNELLLHWQPKVNLITQMTLGAEALIRWQHPTRGLLFPDSFIPFVEHTALIQPLTRWVVKNAISQASKWKNLGYEIDIALNISVRNLQEPDFDRYILDIAEKFNLPIERITIEVTESAIMENVDKAKAALQKLRSAGVKIAIDDFGTGQSSLTYLKDLPISEMKIDKSFVMKLRESSNHAIIKSSIDLAHNLGLSTTAEGIENEDALEELELLGCDIAQGYFISKPLPALQFIDWMITSKWPNTMEGGALSDPERLPNTKQVDSLFYIIYVSTAVSLMSEPELTDILATSEANNSKKDITGLLLYKGGNFMQILEGDKQEVLALYSKISTDRRHKNMTRVFQGNIKKRNFKNWSMGFYNMDKTQDLPEYGSFLESHLSLLVFKEDSQFAYKFMNLFSELR